MAPTSNGEEITPRYPGGWAAVGLLVIGVGLIGIGGLLWVVPQRIGESPSGVLVLGFGGSGAVLIWLASKRIRFADLSESEPPASPPRFTEEFSYGKAPIPLWARGILAMFGTTSLGVAVVGLWLAAREFHLGASIGLILFGLVGSGAIGVVYYLQYFRHFTLEVHDDGIYSRTPTSRHVRYVPITNISDVEWAKGRASRSDIFTHEDYYGEQSDSLHEAMTPTVTLYTHACEVSGGERKRRVEMGHRIDMATEGVVRVDDDANNAVYLFSTDHPERLANSIETARNLAT